MGTERAIYPPIGDYGFLGDCHNWALVSRAGSIDWLCFERAGGHTAFARILDWERGGFCRLAPTGEAEVTRRYIQDTNVLETTFRTGDGTAILTDALVVSPAGGSGGSTDIEPHGQLVRHLCVKDGEVAVTLCVHPRLDYGLTSSHVRVHDTSTATVLGGADALLVHSGIDLEQDDWETCGGHATLTAGDECYVSVAYETSHGLERTDFDVDAVAKRLDETITFWREWAGRCTYDGPYRDHVVRSALTLKALTDTRTGAIIAAPTTSLPEEVGGVRNWDYRFTWIRDAAWHLNALFGLGYEDEAAAFMGWLSRTTAGTADDLQVMYGNTGRRLIPEVDLHELDGYRGSRPVRIGNGAASQFQLDLYGELVSAAWHYHEHGGGFSPELRHLLESVVEVVERRWRDPDKGIWEVRGAPEQFVSSKLYAWVAIDRLLRVAGDGALDVDRERCEALRGDIRTHIERYGIAEKSGAVLRCLGRPGIDASNLLFVLEGFFEADDPHVDATVECILDELADEDGILLRRYASEDGLSGEQSAFFWCSFWLVSVLVERGELQRAREHFEALLAHANDLGLLSEECRMEDGALVGNFPQAVSHVGLIDAALRLYEKGARERATDRVMPS